MVRLYKNILCFIVFVTATFIILIPGPKLYAATDIIPAQINFGNYHALVIGINEYANISNLETAVADAKAIAEVLENKYGFTVDLLINPTRNDIVDRLDILREKLKFRDNLVIYYAGHGWIDEKTGQGYWLPADAKKNRRSAWIPNDTITDSLKALESKHVMVIADSCFSGRMSRGANVSLAGPNYYSKMSRRKTRVILTSGGLEPVADSDGSGHSPFTNALLKVLRSNQAVIDGTTLFNAIRRPVMISAGQTPEYSNVHKAGHNGGDFLFVSNKVRGDSARQNDAVAGAQSDAALAGEMAFWETVRESRLPEVFAAYLKRYPSGQFSGLAQLKLAEATRNLQAQGRQLAALPIDRTADLKRLEGAWDFEVDCGPYSGWGIDFALKADELTGNIEGGGDFLYFKIYISEIGEMEGVGSSSNVLGEIKGKITDWKKGLAVGQLEISGEDFCDGTWYAKLKR